MRLTKKIKENDYMPNFIEYKYGYENCRLECVGKLGKLEDIEEELGIDLSVLFKALKAKELWWKTTRYGIVKTTFQQEGLKPDISFHRGKWLFNLVWNALDDWEEVKDYGKTWALTKEELL